MYEKGKNTTSKCWYGISVKLLKTYIDIYRQSPVNYFWKYKSYGLVLLNVFIVSYGICKVHTGNIMCRYLTTIETI